MVLSEHEIRTAKLVRISSHDRASDSESQYDFKIYTNDYFLNQIRKVIVKSISIPNTEYNVNSKNNTLTYDIGAGDVSVSIPVGQYGNLTTLYDAVALALLNGPDAIVMTYVIDALTNKATLTFGVPIILRGGTSGIELIDTKSTIGHVIGLSDEDTASLLVHPLPNIPDLSGLTKVYVASKALSVSSSMVSSNLVQANVISEINVDQPYGFWIHVDRPEIEITDESTSTIPNNLSSIDIQLLDQKLRPVDLQGIDVYITLCVYS
jgi:hypothetical protein